MRFKLSLLVQFSLLCLSGCLYAQPWSGIIAPGRAIDWSTVGIPGGIPNRTTICSTLSPGATAAQINSAIQNCPSGQVVFLNAGTYNLSSGITFNNKSNVTLRGAGASQTKLIFTGFQGCHGYQANICLDSSDTNWPGGTSNTANWTAGYAKGTTVITLSNTANLAVGKPLILDQLNDSISVDDGQIHVCEDYNSNRALNCSEDGPGGGSSGGQRSGRAQMQIVTVAAINGNQVTISPGLYMPNWSSAKSPGAWWATSPIFSSGVENLSMDNSGSGADVSAVTIFNCSGCFVKGVRSVNPDRNHVYIATSPHTVVKDNYFYGTRNAVSRSYGVEAFASSDSLIENNIFQHITAPQMINAACSGCVVSYNYSIDDYYTASASWMMHSVFMHAGGIDNLLIEGNVGAGLYSDLFHGSHHFVTVFRNRYNGWETGKTDQTTPFAMWPKSRFYNFIGNVLGDVNRPHNNYQLLPSGSGILDQSIYVLGTGAVYTADDPQVAATLMRWGNWDIVSNAARWQASEVPSGITQYPNPVPATQTLPASFYLSAKPSWFGNVPWPAIGPDVTGGNIASIGGKAYKIPAQLCYEGAATDSAYGTAGVKAFSASTCYGAVVTVNPASGLAATAR
jgi:hypothetical protein